MLRADVGSQSQRVVFNAHRQCAVGPFHLESRFGDGGSVHIFQFGQICLHHAPTLERNLHGSALWIGDGEHCIQVAELVWGKCHIHTHAAIHLIGAKRVGAQFEMRIIARNAQRGGAGDVFAL